MKLVTADHYVFCANGAHENPDLKVVAIYVNSRIGLEAPRSKNPEIDRSFKMWFNSTSKQPDTKADYLKHMKKLEKKMKNHKQNSDGRLNYKFFSTAKTEIDF